MKATITEKGQVTIPAIIRQKLNLESGNKLEFIARENDFVVVPINKSANRLKGILPKPKKSLSIDEISNVIKDSYDRD